MASASAPTFQLPAQASLVEDTAQALTPHAHADARVQCIAQHVLQRATCCSAQHVLHKSETHQTSNLENVETSQRKPRLKGPIRCAVCPQLGALLRRVCVQERSTECYTHMPPDAPCGLQETYHALLQFAVDNHHDLLQNLPDTFF
jgi:hypothetical protein